MLPGGGFFTEGGFSNVTDIDFSFFAPGKKLKLLKFDRMQPQTAYRDEVRLEEVDSEVVFREDGTFLILPPSF